MTFNIDIMMREAMLDFNARTLANVLELKNPGFALHHPIDFYYDALDIATAFVDLSTLSSNIHKLIFVRLIKDKPQITTRELNEDAYHNVIDMIEKEIAIHRSRGGE